MESLRRGLCAVRPADRRRPDGLGFPPQELCAAVMNFLEERAREERVKP